MIEIKLDIISKATLIAENVLKSKLSENDQHTIMQASIESTKKILN